LILAIDHEVAIHVRLQQQSGYQTVLGFLMFLLFLFNHLIISLQISHFDSDHHITLTEQGNMLGTTNPSRAFRPD